MCFLLYNIVQDESCNSNSCWYLHFFSVKYVKENEKRTGRLCASNFVGWLFTLTLHSIAVPFIS